MNREEIKRLIGETFNDIAMGLETGHFSKKVKVGLTTLGSEHGVETLVKAAELAAKDQLFDVVLIGPKVETELEIVEVNCESDAHQKMEALLDSGYLQGAVTMHYNFPIGVSTVGRVITPAFGKEMLIATTTGTSDTDRTISMFKNAIYGIITAKALGNPNPSLGILNLDNARGVERMLKKLKENGYPLQFGSSVRQDGGTIMRGNDLLTGSVDVMVTDTLTGNILMKLFSSFNTGGSYEAVGFGYGPGIGFDYNRIINIISRASGIPVIANALRYVAALSRGNLQAIIKQEVELLSKCHFQEIIAEYKASLGEKAETAVTFKMPEKETVTSEISGIDIMELDAAVQVILKNGIYAETGMGCTGPIVLVNPANLDKAKTILKEHNYIS